MTQTPKRWNSKLLLAAAAVGGSWCREPAAPAPTMARTCQAATTFTISSNTSRRVRNSNCLCEAAAQKEYKESQAATQAVPQ